jgi:hypothetical protein
MDNANELIPDDRRRVLASEARKFADGGAPIRTRFKQGRTYFDGIIKTHEKLFWQDTYHRRKQRLARIAAKKAA